MSSQPIVTAEELACLLAPVANARAAAPSEDKTSARLLHMGAALWLLKALLGYSALQVLAADTLPLSYLLSRGLLEAACALAFWGTLRQSQRRHISLGALQVSATTAVMDLLTLMALSA
jgi:hypothetical protein